MNINGEKYTYRDTYYNHDYDITNAINLIKKYEGCKLKAYKCPAGVWTIGYGYTHDVKENDVITQDKAELLLYNEVLIICDKLSKLTQHYGLNENQFNAFISFYYNLGFNNGITSRFMNLVNMDIILSNITLYNKANGVKLEAETEGKHKQSLINEAFLDLIQKYNNKIHINIITLILIQFVILADVFC
jgi:lysozyme